MHTTNGGINWNEQITLSGDLRHLTFVNENSGFIAGDFTYRTTDGGNNWNIMQLPTTAHYSGVSFPDEQNGWMVGGENSSGNGVIYHSTDGGENWSLQNTPTLESLYGVYFINSTAGWAVGHIGTVATTDNSTPVELISFSASVDYKNVTLTWKTATELNNSGFEIQRIKGNDITQSQNWNAVGFIEGQGTTTEMQNYSYVDKNLERGKYSYRLVQIDFDGTRNESDIVKVEINSQPTDFVLLQNYPNPFNPSTTIKYSIPVNGNVKLTVYNSIGEEIKTLVNEYKTSGTHEVELNAEKLTSGIYFYKIETGEFSSVKKMILIK